MDEDDLVPGSLVRRWRLGKRLREMREAAGKSVAEAGHYLGVKQPTISRIERGRFAILPRNVRLYGQLCGVGAPAIDTLVRQAEEANDRGWWMAYSDTMPDWFETYVGFEADARKIWKYESEQVPGLLQTPEHVMALRRAHGHTSDDDLAKSVEFRLARQSRLAMKPPLLRVVLNEAVVRRRVGSAGDMAAQLRHLARIGREKWATIQVLPFDVGPHPATSGPFSLLTLPEESDPNFVYLEHLDGALYLERPDDLGRYAEAFERLTDMALSPEVSREFLATLAAEYSGEQGR
ncbi:MAG TPA: helix-turn-helix transcriptional regulator [Pseudonocardiaceae bacterium]|jgi:transcriptional regulator with XRE-family HTH domain|nr:helix-turn-helix transcriptional regulator [Pseudonocardiaceae bacterium]